MKPSATGRILLWRGGSIWIGLAGVVRPAPVARDRRAAGIP
jgi:hypothetical protein